MATLNAASPCAATAVATRARSGRIRRARAFSALEMIVASLILVVAISIAASLLTEVFAHVAWTGAVLTTMVPEVACAQLRTDFHASRGTSGGFESFATLPLEFSAHGQLISYELAAGGKLERSQFDASLGEWTTRPVLDNVVSFQWRRLGAAVEVEIVSWRAAPPNIGAEAAAGQQSRDRLLRTDRLVLAPRRQVTNRF